MLINDDMITTVKKLAMVMLKNDMFINSVVNMNGYHIGQEFQSSLRKLSTAYMDVAARFSVSLGILEEIIPKIKLMSKDKKISSINSRAIIKYSLYSEDIDYDRIDMSIFNYYVNNSEFIALNKVLLDSYKESLDVIKAHYYHLEEEKSESKKETMANYKVITELTEKIMNLLSELESVRDNSLRIIDDLDKVLPVIFKRKLNDEDYLVLNEFYLAYPSDVSETIAAGRTPLPRSR